MISNTTTISNETNTVMEIMKIQTIKRKEKIKEWDKLRIEQEKYGESYRPILKSRFRWSIAEFFTGYYFLCPICGNILKDNRVFDTSLHILTCDCGYRYADDEPDYRS